MSKDRRPFPPLNQLPLLSHASSGELDSLRDQLANFERAKNKPYVLDDETIDGVVKSCVKQNKSIPEQKAWCAQWREQMCNRDQLNTIDEILNNLNEMEKINQKIVSLANDCKQYTINRILEMEEGELAIAHLLGKIKSPKESYSKPHAHPPKKRFPLPPEVTMRCEKIKNKGEAYTFEHAQLGEIGRIDVIPHGTQTHLSAFAVQSDPRDPMGRVRDALFRVILSEFSQEMKEKHGSGLEIKSAEPLVSNQKMVESKAMVCLTCDTPVALLVFAQDATTAGRLEDYARIMYSQIVEMNLPTWIIGQETEIVPEKEGSALILKIWPERRTAETISSLVFEPMLHRLQTKHCQ